VGIFIWARKATELSVRTFYIFQREVEQRRALLDASPQLQDLPSELWLSEVDYIQTDHDRRRRAKPPTRRRASDSEAGSDGHVAGALDEANSAARSVPWSAWQ
jgi:hypothetical protein